MKKILLMTATIGSIIFSTTAFSYTPTVESLFRNGNNVDVGSNTIVGTLKIERKIKPEQMELLKEFPIRSAVKVLFGNEREDRSKFIQIDYLDGIISNNTMSKIHYTPRLSLKNLSFTDQQIEGRVFYATLAVLLNNNPDLMMGMLKSLGSEIKTNEKSINSDLNSTLGNYKNYLKKVSEIEDEELLAEIENPLKPEADEDKKIVKDILKKPFFEKSPYVFRVRENNKFYWDINEPKIYARFDAETHRLLKLSIKTESGDIDLTFYNYILFNGQLEFPEIIYLKDLAGDMYEIKMKKIYSIKDTTESFNKRFQNYKKALKENTDIKVQIKPHFIL